MLVPYSNSSTSSKDDIMKTITSDEREKVKEIESLRGSSLDRFCRYSALNEPSIVLDDFLFLGNMQHATNRELLQRFEIIHFLWHFDRTNELLRGFYEKNERCLVHCAAGVSRSATIVLAYLMKYHHNTLKEAYFFLVEKRPQVFPNEGFLLQLIRYEKDLIQSREIHPIDVTKSIVKQENPIETVNEFEEKHITDE